MNKSSADNTSKSNFSNSEVVNTVGFSWKEFLAVTFGHHPSPEYEERLTVGTKSTTPQLSYEMSKIPRPWLFVRVLFGTLLGYLLLLLLLIHYGPGAIRLLPALIFYGCFALPCAVLTLFFEINTPRNVSVFFLIRLIFIGGALSFLITFLLFDYFPLQNIYGPSAAGLIEEIAKVIVIIIFSKELIHGRHPWILNGLLYGAAVGVGFAAFESAGYALSQGLINNSFSSLNWSIIVRGMLAPFNHIPWSAIAGAAFWLAYKQRHSVVGAIFSVPFIALLCIPMALHFAWNFDFASFLNLPVGFEHFKWIALGLIAWAVIARLVATGLHEIANISGVRS